MKENENHLSWRLHDLWSDVEDYMQEVFHDDVPQHINNDFFKLHKDLQMIEEVLEKLQRFSYGLYTPKDQACSEEETKP